MKEKRAKIILNSLCAGITNLQTLEAITTAMNAFDEITRLKDEKEGLINGQITLQKALARAEAKVESKSAVMETMARCIEIQETEIKRLTNARAEIEHLKKLLAESEAREMKAAKYFYK